MSDLIDRKALITRCKPGGDLYSEVLESEDLVEVLVEAPAVNAVEVVRCKDCARGFERDGLIMCNYFGCWMDCGEYCSQGERKNDG